MPTGNLVALVGDTVVHDGSVEMGGTIIPGVVEYAPLAGMGEAIQIGTGDPPADPIRRTPVPRRLAGKPRLAGFLINTPWLIHPQWLQAIYDMADGLEVSVDALPGNGRSLAYQGEVIALERQRGEPLPGTRMTTVRNGIATIAIDGVIIPKADFFSEMSGAVSLASIARDFNAALRTPDVRAILLNIDSPGGSADAVDEMAAMIRDGAAKKPVWCYVSALMASAAYWIGSAATRIIVGRTASLGSIGTVAIVPTGNDDGYVEIVSSQSPKKRMDPESDEGRAEIQQHVDDLTDIFMGAVASYRGVTVETVASDFGQGGIFLGQRAVAAGMADEIGSYESALAALAAHCDARERSQLMAQDQPIVEASTDQIETVAADPRLAAMEQELAALKAERETLIAAQAREKRTAFESRIKSMAREKGWPGADADHLAVVTALRDAADGDDNAPAVAAYVRTLNAAAAQKEVGALFGEMGVSGSESAASAIDRAHALAGQIVASSQGKTTFEQALTITFNGDRQLEADYAKEVAGRQPKGN